MVSSVLISWNAVQERVHEFHAWLLLLGFGMTGVFLSFDIILFYVFFELSLIPLFFLIGMWGGPERRHAARKFFICTLAGSLITLLGAARGRRHLLSALEPACADLCDPRTGRDVQQRLGAKRPRGADREFYQSFAVLGLPRD